jgi:poly-gamma-glutamate capsule biosynthesis protein CapA/YwtB (metallophosphatase superfamily)
VSFRHAVELVLLASLLSACSSSQDAPGDFSCADPCDLYQVVWVGDILLADEAQPFLDQYGYGWPFEEVQALIDADYLVGNAEGPITRRDRQYIEGQVFHYNAQPESVPALVNAGFDAMGLANNHALDRGPQGLKDTLTFLDRAGVQTFGAGPEIDTAAEPLLIETPRGVIGVLAFGLERPGTVADDDSAGINPLTEEAIEAGADRAREAGADWVVAYVHWGQNYTPVDGLQRSFAETFAGAGYSLVVGHHPHIQQGVEFVDDTLVLYSLGNFTFGTAGRFTEAAPGYGLVARTFFDGEGLAGVELTCILTDNDEVLFQPRPCDEETGREVIENLGPAVATRDGIGSIVVDR